MTPKEKAIEIVIKMQFQKEPLMFEQAKQCALIAIDEILSIPYLLKYETWLYKEIKNEIEKL